MRLSCIFFTKQSNFDNVLVNTVRLLSLFNLKGSEPHEPVQPVVIRRDEARPSVQSSRFTQELILLPYHLVSGVIDAQRALKHHLRPLLSDAAPETHVSWLDSAICWLLMSFIQSRRLYMPLSDRDGCNTCQRLRTCWRSAADQTRCSSSVWSSAGSARPGRSDTLSESPETHSARAWSTYLTRDTIRGKQAQIRNIHYCRKMLRLLFIKEALHLSKVTVKHL